MRIAQTEGLYNKPIRYGGQLKLTIRLALTGSHFHKDVCHVHNVAYVAQLFYFHSADWKGTLQKVVSIQNL